MKNSTDSTIKNPGYLNRKGTSLVGVLVASAVGMVAIAGLSQYVISTTKKREKSQ